MINTNVAATVATFESESVAPETSRITIQREGDGTAGGGCLRYLYEDNRLAGVVACPDCDSCDLNDCDAPDQRRLDLSYDSDHRLTSWSGGCATCNSGAETIEYYPYDPTLGDFQLVKSRTDAFGKKLVIYHYDEANEVSGVFRGSDVSSNGEYLIVKEVEDFATNGTFEVTTNGVDVIGTNGTIDGPQERITKLYVDNEYYEQIYETYTPKGTIGSRTVWEGLKGTGAAYTTMYNTNGNIVETRLPRDNFIREYLGTSTNPGLVIKQVRSDGASEKMADEYTYEVIRETPMVKTAKNPYGGTTEYFYYTSAGKNGLLEHRLDPTFGDFGATSGKRFEVKYEYDGWQHLTKESRLIDTGVWVVTDYQCDTKGRMWQQTEDFGGTLNLITTFTYNPFNQQTKTVDPRGVKHHMKYCPSGQLEREYTLRDLNANDTGPALEETQYEFDDAGRLQFLKVADDDVPFTPGSPADWFVTEYQYDIYGRRTAMIVEGTLTTSYEYDNQNRITKTTTPGGVWTKIERNGRGLQTAEVIGFGDTEVLRKTFQYDANGNLAQVIEPSGRETTYEYDLFDRVTIVTRE